MSGIGKKVKVPTAFSFKGLQWTNQCEKGALSSNLEKNNSLLYYYAVRAQLSEFVLQPENKEVHDFYYNLAMKQ